MAIFVAVSALAATLTLWLLSSLLQTAIQICNKPTVTTWTPGRWINPNSGGRTSSNYLNGPTAHLTVAS